MKKLTSLVFIVFLINSNFTFAETNWITKKKLDQKIEGICTTFMSIKDLNLEADKFYDDNVYNESFKCALIAADKGDAYAQGNVGWHYQTGNGIGLDNKKAVKWFKVGADQGAPYSITQLAHHYLEGLGVAKDEKKAFGLNMRAANLGYAYGQAEVGWHYLNGIGVKHNNKIAVKWFQMAAEQNNAFAQANLGWMIANGQGIQQDYQKGLEWTKKAADRDNDYAQSNLGWHYENGYGVEKNIDEAIKWFELAAKQDNEYAEERLLDLTKSETTTAESSFITKKDSKTISESNESNELTSWITKKTKEEVRKDEAKEKIVVAEKKKNSQITEIPILEEWVVEKKTRMLENHNVESKSLVTLLSKECVFVLKEIENTDVIGIWFKIERENGEIGYALKNKFTPNKQSNCEGSGGGVDDYPPDWDIEWGNYYALVIGNNNYKIHDPLETAINDATDIGNLLKTKYGFKGLTKTDSDDNIIFDNKIVFEDASKNEIMSALNDYRNILGKNDNLLIYYAGHGDRSEFIDQGYWIPIGSTSDYWDGIKNIDIVSLIERLNAKHVIVISDSCFSGSIFKDSYIPPGEKRSVLRGEVNDIPKDDPKNSALYDYYLLKNKQIVRVAMTSGNFQYVPDKINKDSNHSPFAQTFIDILTENKKVLLSHQLFVDLEIRIRKYSTEQEPLYDGLDVPKHSTGAHFIFVPVS